MVRAGREHSSPWDQPVRTCRQGHWEDFWNISFLPVSRGGRGRDPCPWRPAKCRVRHLWPRLVPPSPQPFEINIMAASPYRGGARGPRKPRRRAGPCSYAMSGPK